MSYYYTIKDDLVYKKTPGDKHKYPWDVYSAKSHMWVVCNKQDKDFRESDYVSEEDALKFKDELEEKAKKHPGRPRKKDIKQINDSEGTAYVSMCPKCIEVIPPSLDDLEGKDKTYQDASSIDSKLEQNERITYMTNNNSTGIKDESGAVDDNKLKLDVGSYFVSNGYLYQVTSMNYEARTVNADYSSTSPKYGKYRRMPAWNSKMPFETVEKNLISEEEALKRMNKFKFSKALKSTIEEDDKIIIAPGMYFVYTGYLFRITSTITASCTMPPKMVAVYADYLNLSQGKFVPWGERISIKDVENNIISNEDAEARIAKASSVNLKEEGEKYMEKEKGNIELAGKVLEEAENILRKGNYRIGEGLDGTGLEATIVPKKTLAIKVPTTITEGSRIELKNNVYLWEVVGISGPRDFNTMYKDVQKLRCVALAKNIIMRYKEDVTDVKEILDIIDNCLEETYVYLEPLYNLYDPEEKDEERAVMPRYLSKSDLEDRIAKILPGEKADEDK